MNDQEKLFVPDIQYLVYRECPVDWCLEPYKVAVADYHITYIIDGNVCYTINGKRHELGAGTLICLPEGVKEEAITYPDRLMHCFAVLFRLKDTHGGIVTPPFPQITNIGIKDDLIRLFHELVFTWRDGQSGYGIKSSGLLILILHRLYELTVYHQDGGIGDFRIRRAMIHIAQHYTERLSVQELAKMVSLNTAYFGVLFKRETGCSVNQYVAKTRIRNAKNLLQSGMYRVCEVADQCGYGDMFHFYKQFKAIMGEPPSRYIPNHSD
jgi:AraC-like DNA-binding protein